MRGSLAFSGCAYEAKLGVGSRRDEPTAVDPLIGARDCTRDNSPMCEKS
jgi:hypothetical protein